MVARPSTNGLSSGGCPYWYPSISPDHCARPPGRRPAAVPWTPVHKPNSDGGVPTESVQPALYVSKPVPNALCIIVPV